jgi:hypothetical protein
MKKNSVALVLLFAFIVVDIYLIINFFDNKVKLVAAIVSLLLFIFLLVVFLRNKKE